MAKLDVVRFLDLLRSLARTAGDRDALGRATGAAWKEPQYTASMVIHEAQLAEGPWEKIELRVTHSQPPVLFAVLDARPDADLPKRDAFLQSGLADSIVGCYPNVYIPPAGTHTVVVRMENAEVSVTFWGHDESLRDVSLAFT